MSEPTESDVPPEEDTSAEEKSEESANNGEETNGDGQPLTREKRALIDVPERHNTGTDGNPTEEFN